MNCSKNQTKTDDIDLTIPPELLEKPEKPSLFSYCLSGLSHAKTEHQQGNLFINVPYRNIEEQQKLEEVLRKYYDGILLSPTIMDIDSIKENMRTVANFKDSLDNISIDYTCFDVYMNSVILERYGAGFYKDVWKLVDSVYTKDKKVWGVDIDGNCYPVHPLKRLKITEAEFEKLAKEYFSSIHGLEGLPLSARCDARLVINKKGKIVDIQLTRKVNKRINQLVKEFVKTTDDLWLPYIKKETKTLENYVITIYFVFRNGIGLYEVSL